MYPNLQAWRKYLESLSLTALHLPANRASVVAQRLDLLTPACPVITVGGTNGKGSVVSLLESIYCAQGYRVAAFTSPYLVSFNEQFRLNKTWASDEELCEYFAKIEKAKGEVLLTFFEYKTLAALLHFKKHQPDMMILEVGLGGRLDTVNMLDADVAVITSISLDHCDWLGHTRELIAIEKAGIFRKHQRIVCGDPNPPAVLQTMAKQLNAQWYCRDQDFYVEETQPQCSLLPDNIATAMMVVKIFDFSVSPASLKKGIEEVQLMGRQQVIQAQPLVVVDVAHNEDSVQRLAGFLKGQACHKIKAVFSALKTKDVATIIRCMEGVVDEWHIAPIIHPSAMPVEKIAEMLRSQKVFRYTDVRTAFDAAVASARAEDGVVAFGSFHVVGDVLSMRLSAHCFSKAKKSGR